MFQCILSSFHQVHGKVEKFPKNVSSNLELSQGVYVVSGECLVEKDVNLIISGQTQLRFEPGATIKILGGLKIQGSANNLIVIQSVNPEKPGMGFVFSGFSNTSVEINFARFNHLQKPIYFDFRWGREYVSIEKNIFKNAAYTRIPIEIRDMDTLLMTKNIQFKFVDNTLSNSKSGILISSFSGEKFQMIFEKNVITVNQFYGSERNSLFTTPIYLTHNLETPYLSSTFKYNSIFDNYMGFKFADSSTIERVSLTIIGNANVFRAEENYFGDLKNDEIMESIDFYSIKYNTPYFDNKNQLEVPSKDLNGHFYQTLLNGKEIRPNFLFNDFSENVNNITLSFNRAVAEGLDFSVFYAYFDNSSIVFHPVKNKTQWSDGHTKLKIVINENIFKQFPKGFLAVDGLYDLDGMDVPRLEIGRAALDESMFNALMVDFKPITSSVLSVIKTNDSVALVNPNLNISEILSQMADTLVERKDKFWDLGLFAGNALYFGDMNTTTFTIDPRNMRPNLGLRIGYQITEHWRANFFNNNLIIYGSDLPREGQSSRFTRTTGFERGFSVRTTIVDAALLLDFNFNKFKTKRTWIFSAHGGGQVYYFKPMSQIDGQGKWYDLRTIGTAGQTFDGRKYAYDRFMFGIPMGLALKRHLTQNLMLTISYTYAKLFTDYLDDLGVDPYSNPDDLRRANPTQPEVAVKLSNPNNQTGFRTYSDNNDAYGYWGVTFNWKLRAKKKETVSPISPDTMDEETSIITQ